MELLTIIQPKVFNTLNPGKIVNFFKLGEGKQVNESKIAYEKAVTNDEIDLDMGFIMMPDAIPAAKPSEVSDARN